MVEGIVWHFEKYAYSLSGAELDEDIDATLMSIQLNM